jgi:hypothetical protein
MIRQIVRQGLSRQLNLTHRDNRETTTVTSTLMNDKAVSFQGGNKLVSRRSKCDISTDRTSLKNVSTDRGMYIHIYIYMYTYIYLYTYIYI